MMDDQNIAKEASRVTSLEASHFPRTSSVSGPEAAPPALGISDSDLDSAAALIDVLAPNYYSSHRKILGPAIVAGKSLLAAMVSKLLKLVLWRQVQFNQYMWNSMLCIQSLNQRVHELEERLRSLEGDEPSKKI